MAYTTKKTGKKTFPKKSRSKISRKNISKNPLVLYSAGTWLAYNIAERFYGVHYLWCTPYFDPNSSERINYSVPPSSSPREIYWGLWNDVNLKDHHSAKIQENREGLRRGVNINLKLGVINKKVAQEIRFIIDNAEIADFSPVIYVIPFNLVQKRIKRVPVSKRAHAFSEEYIIDGLPREHFDLIMSFSSKAI